MAFQLKSTLAPTSMKRQVLKPPKPLSVLEETFLLHLRSSSLESGLEREFRFAPPRRWRFDFAWPDKKIAIELEGGVYSSGRHVRAQGFENDCLKYNEAVLRGWRVLRFAGRQITNGAAINTTQELFCQREE